MGDGKKRILVTRARPEGKSLMEDSLRKLGFAPEYLECVRYVFADGIREVLERERSRLFQGYYDWLAVSSPRTVGFLAATGFFRQPVRERIPPQCSVAAVGDATQLALEKHAGITAAIVPSAVGKQASARELLEVFPDKDNGSQKNGRSVGRVFLPQSTEARDILTEGLRKKGWEVRRLGIYEPVVVDVKGTAGYEKLMAGRYGALLVTSIRAMEALGLFLPGGVRVYTLGRQTHAELMRRGIANDILTGVL